MPMSPGRWARRVRETAREQRTRDRSRLLPGNSPEADDWTQPIQGLEDLHVAAQGVAEAFAGVGRVLEDVADAVGQTLTTFDDYLRPIFGIPPPMDITNVAVDMEAPPMANVLAYGEAYPVAMIPMDFPRYTVRVNGRMSGRTQEQWDELNRWTQEPAHGVVNTVMTQWGDFHRGGTEIEITAHPPGIMQQIAYRLAPLRDAMPVMTWEYTGIDWVPAGAYIAPTPEQVASAAAVAEESKRAREQREAERKAARERAMNLFLGTLTPRERQEYDKSKAFRVRGSRGTDYQITCAGQSGNVLWYDKDGEVRGSMCAHPEGYLPDPDAWLAQRLILMTDEKKFVNTSYRISGTKPEYADA